MCEVARRRHVSARVCWRVCAMLLRHILAVHVRAYVREHVVPAALHQRNGGVNALWRLERGREIYFHRVDVRPGGRKHGRVLLCALFERAAACRNGEHVCHDLNVRQLSESLLLAVEQAAREILSVRSDERRLGRVLSSGEHDVGCATADRPDGLRQSRAAAGRGVSLSLCFVDGIVGRYTHDGEEVLAEAAPHGWGPRFDGAVVGAHQVMKGDLGRTAPWRRGTQVEMARQRRIGSAADFGPRRERNTVRQNSRDPWAQHARRRLVSSCLHQSEAERCTERFPEKNVFYCNRNFVLPDGEHFF